MANHRDMGARQINPSAHSAKKKVTHGGGNTRSHCADTMPIVSATAVETAFGHFPDRSMCVPPDSLSRQH
jgi:hypothetical protein